MTAPPAEPARNVPALVEAPQPVPAFDPHDFAAAVGFGRWLCRQLGLPPAEIRAAPCEAFAQYDAAAARIIIDPARLAPIGRGFPTLAGLVAHEVAHHWGADHHRDDCTPAWAAAVAAVCDVLGATPESHPGPCWPIDEPGADVWRALYEIDFAGD